MKTESVARMRGLAWLLVIVGTLAPAGLPASERGASRPRARDLGITIGRHEPGTQNAITDVAGVRVGHVTRSFGNGPLRPGVGPARTGVTVVIPRDDVWHRKVPAAGVVANGCGEVTGLAWVNESGWLEVPIVITNSHCVGRGFDGVITWMMRDNPLIGVEEDVVDPVVGECDDSALNDVRGRHVRERDVVDALDRARAGPVEEGCVGAGTGMIAFGFKAGVGTASRVVTAGADRFTVGSLVVANFGAREDMQISGVPVGREISEREVATAKGSNGSIIIVIATDAPLDARQLGRVARRAWLALARLGTPGNHGSGDFTIAFSTAHRIPADASGRRLAFRLMSDLDLDELFQAAEEAVEEAVVNSLLRATTVTGRDGAVATAIPIQRLLDVMKQYGRSPATGVRSPETAGPAAGLRHRDR